MAAGVKRGRPCPPAHVGHARPARQQCHSEAQLPRAASVTRTPGVDGHQRPGLGTPPPCPSSLTCTVQAPRLPTQARGPQAPSLSPTREARGDVGPDRTEQFVVPHAGRCGSATGAWARLSMSPCAPAVPFQGPPLGSQLTPDCHSPQPRGLVGSGSHSGPAGLPPCPGPWGSWSWRWVGHLCSLRGFGVGGGMVSPEWGSCQHRPPWASDPASSFLSWGSWRCPTRGVWRWPPSPCP